MERVVSATEARVRFGEMIRRAVEDQEAIIVERAGEPQVVLISVAQYQQLKLAEGTDVSWQECVDETRKRMTAESGDRQLVPAEEIIRKMREERDAQLVDLR